MCGKPVGLGIGQNPDFADEAAFSLYLNATALPGLIQQAAHGDETVVFIVDFGEARDLQFGRIAVHNAQGQQARPRKPPLLTFR